MTAPGLAIKGGLPPGPGHRWCCTLQPSNAGGLLPRVVDLSYDLQHRYGWRGLPLFFPGHEISGVMYTCALGFLDLGHVRDNIDLTWFYYQHLTKHGRWKASATGFRTFVSGGKVTVLQDIPKADRLLAARSMAYDESIFHELETYWCFSTGFHNSSFSPEDFVSNLLGTWIAELAITTMGQGVSALAQDFDTEATSALESVLIRLGALPNAGTLDAFSKITGPTGWMDGSVLRRRNFSYRPINPWLVPGVTGCPHGSVPSEFAFELPARLDAYYNMEFEVSYSRLQRDKIHVRAATAAGPGVVVGYLEYERDGDMIPGYPTRITKATFASETQRIRAEAQARYGSTYDHQ